MLLTRPSAETARTAAALRARGFRPIAAPLLRIEHVPWPVRPGAPPPRAVLLTSGNALPAIAPLVGRAPLFAVGDATASRARAAGWTAVESADGDAASLLALVQARLRPGAGALLLPCGAGQGRALAGALRGAGLPVIRRVAYRQHPAPSWPEAASTAIEAGLHATIFMSRSASLAFGRLLPDRLAPLLASVRAVAISSAAAQPVAALPWRELRVAVRPTQKDVLALL